ncbi:hypothetical protein HPP92_003733 [Vanilla planifolia]|uniref:Uncharacterized protein n=1 Tax=Vanilla planifolia TaxID=51239 RepID=A0A835S484_VANPL|nr:hypothetical protein HPP92_003733 [Vanilla planifolia]
MSIALQSGSGFLRGIGFVPINESEEFKRLDPIKPSQNPEGAEGAEDSVSSSSFSSCSSSIGKDSDAEGSDEEEENGEVQSKYKGPLEGMTSLEESLPIRRGISSFYAGKSKSFTSLSEAISSSVCSKDLGKTENAYSRRRKTALALKVSWDKPYSSVLRSSRIGITKKSPTPTRSTLAIAVAMSSSPRPPLPPSVRSTTTAASPMWSPLLQQCSFPTRSFSLGDLSEI